MIHASPESSIASTDVTSSVTPHDVVTICVVPSNDFINPTSYRLAPFWNATRSGFERLMLVELDPSSTPIAFVYVIVFDPVV